MALRPVENFGGNLTKKKTIETSKEDDFKNGMACIGIVTIIVLILISIIYIGTFIGAINETNKAVQRIEMNQNKINHNQEYVTSDKILTPIGVWCTTVGKTVCK